MRRMKYGISLDPRLFGRGRTFLFELVEGNLPSAAMMNDIRLFATTFVGGFLFFAIYLS